LAVIAATLPIQLGAVLPCALLGQQIVEQELEDGAVYLVRHEPTNKGIGAMFIRDYG